MYGGLALLCPKSREFTAEEVRLAGTFGDQAAVAIENARLYERTQRRVAQLSALQRVSAAIAGTLELPSLLRLIAQAIQTAAGFEVAMVSLVEGDPPVLRRVASAGLDPDPFREMASVTTPLTRFTTLAREEFRLGNAYYYPASRSSAWSPAIPSIQVMRNRSDWRPGMWHPQDMLIVPLGDLNDHVLGIISVDKPDDGRAPTAETIEILELLANQAAIAIQNVRQYEHAEESAAAAERNRLARDLHDAVTQTLFSASLIAEVLPRLWERNPDEGRRRLQELHQLTRGALAEMRTLLLELRPSALTEASLAHLLRQLAEATTGRARIPVSFALDERMSLPPETQVALYRIAQEALNNVAKHSGASHASVSLQVEDGQVALRVADDGRGFAATQDSPEHLGLGIMRERAEAIGALLQIESEPGKGTEVVVVWQNRQAQEGERRENR